MWIGLLLKLVCYIKLKAFLFRQSWQISQFYCIWGFLFFFFFTFVTNGATSCWTLRNPATRRFFFFFFPFCQFIMRETVENRKMQLCYKKTKGHYAIWGWFSLQWGVETNSIHLPKRNGEKERKSPHFFIHASQWIEHNVCHVQHNCPASF